MTPLVWHMSRGNSVNRDLSEDVTQTVWLAFFEQLDTLTRGVAQRVLRGQTATEALLEDEQAELRDSERNGRLWRAFERLPLQYQEILRLTVLAGRTEYRVVGAAMGMSAGEVGPSRGRALNMLREFLAEEDAAEAQREKEAG